MNRLDILERNWQLYFHYGKSGIVCGIVLSNNYPITVISLLGEDDGLEYCYKKALETFEYLRTKPVYIDGLIQEKLFNEDTENSEEGKNN